MGLWDSLRYMNQNNLEPWLILRDFNIILSHEDRINGDPVRPQEIEAFQSCIDDNSKEKGRYFTWCSKRDGLARIYTHIDWAFGNAECMLKHGNTEADFIDSGYSDHTPIVVNTRAI